MHRVVNFVPRGSRQLLGVGCEMARTIADITRLVVGASEDGHFRVIEGVIDKIDMNLTLTNLQKQDLIAANHQAWEGMLLGVSDDEEVMRSQVLTFKGGSVYVASLRIQALIASLQHPEILGPYLTAPMSESLFRAYLGHALLRSRRTFPLAGFVGTPKFPELWEAEYQNGRVFVHRRQIDEPHVLPVATTLILRA